MDTLFKSAINDEGTCWRNQLLPILYYMRGEKEKGLLVIEEDIIRQQQPVSEDEIAFYESLKRAGAKEVIYSTKARTVDPLYLEFAEKYKMLK